jgi:glycosyltransferase involved in cell wall biosynthesis
MKFVIVIDRLYDLNGTALTIGGIQTYLINLAKVINENYHVKPFIYQAANDDFRLECDDYYVIGVKVHKSSKISKSMKSIVANIKRSFASENTLIIWGSDQYSSNISDFKSINIQHGIGFDTEAVDSKIKKFIVESNFSYIYKFLQRWKARKHVKAGNRVVCVDYNFQNWIRTYICKNKERFVVIPNFSKCKFDTLNNKLMNDITKVVISRRFVKRRGIDLAVNCAKNILANNPNVHFTFAGSGPEIIVIEALKDIYPENISITKYSSEESLDFHRDFHIALVPSIGSEGTSLALLEAMSVGCLVVCTDIGGMANVVLDNHNGFIVAPLEKDITQALRNAIDNFDSYEYARINAMKTIQNSFDYKSWSDKWIKVIHEVK